MPEYLEPVVTKLLGDLSDLAKTVAEAEALMKGFQDRTERTSTESGKRTGKKTGESILDELKKALASGGLGELDLGETGRRIEAEFRKAGKTGGTGLLHEFQKILGAGGMETDVGRQVTDSFTQFGVRGGVQAGEAFSKGFGGFLGDLGGAVGPALVPVAVQAVSLIFAAAGGLISGGTGIAAITAGAITQIKTNPEVQAAAHDFGHWLGEQWKVDTAAFADPVRDALGLLKTDLRGPMSELREDFAAVAPYTREFATYLGAAAERIMPGLNRLIKESGPNIRELGHDFVILAGGVSDFADQVSRGGKGETEALRTLAITTADVLGFTGATIHALSVEYDWLVRTESAIVDWSDKWLGSWTLAGPVIDATGIKDKLHQIINAYDDSGSHIGRMLGPMDDLSRSAQRQKDAVDALTKTWDDWFGKSMNVDEANLRLHEDITRLTESIQQNGHHWDLNTKAGQENYGALLNLIKGTRDVRDAQIASGVSTQQANKEYAQTIEFYLAMAQKAGLSAAQVQYLRAQVDGLSGALSSLDGKVAHYAIIGSTIGPGGKESGFYQGLSRGGYVEPGGIVHAAQGLVSGVLPPRSPGTLIMAGEPQTGGEVLTPLRGISQQRAMSLAGVIGDAYGFNVGGRQPDAGGDLTVNVVLRIGDAEFYERVVLPGKLKWQKNYGTSP